MKKKIIEILENNADWANTYASDVVFSGKFDDVANEIEKLFIEEQMSKILFETCQQASVSIGKLSNALIEGCIPHNIDDVVVGYSGLELKPKPRMINEMIVVHDPQYQKNTEKPKKPVCNPYARKFKRGWSKM